MDLIIKPNTFNKDKIRFKYGKRCIKIIYDLDHLRMIGITLKIIPKKIIEDEHFLFLHIFFLFQPLIYILIHTFKKI